MSAIPDAVARMLAAPAPVIILDTCSLLDLFRRDDSRKQPRVPVDEIAVAVEILRETSARPNWAHLVVPELVPGEFADHADQIEQTLESWLTFHDENQDWLRGTAPLVGVTPPVTAAVGSLGLQAHLRRLADDLLARAVVLDRDPACLNRAVDRLIAKRRPSHKKEIKDSMNLEQCLELGTRLKRAGFAPPVAFVSSNTNDFAESLAVNRIHLDLRAEFAAASLEYFTSLRAAVGTLRSRGELP